MLTDAPGSPDGVKVNQYEAGVEYDVTEDLGEVFLRFELAEPAGDTAAPRAKAKAKAKASKDAGAAPENKQA